MSDTTVINLLVFFVGLAWAVGLFLGLWLGRRGTPSEDTK